MPRPSVNDNLASHSDIIKGLDILMFLIRYKRPSHHLLQSLQSRQGICGDESLQFFGYTDYKRDGNISRGQPVM
uniref:Histone ubiquitination proteins group n=1 Tax=Solanum tuberosum TaxID=4113 RepID=M1A829_SOLTU